MKLLNFFIFFRVKLILQLFNDQFFTSMKLNFFQQLNSATREQMKLESF